LASPRSVLQLDEHRTFGKAPTGPPRRRLRRRWRRLATTLAVAAVVGVLVAGLVDNLEVRSRLSAERQTLARDLVVHHRTAHRLVATDSSTRYTVIQRNALRWTVDAASTEYAIASQHLSTAKTALALQNYAIGVLHQCLGGVSQTYNQLSANNLPGAVNALDAVAGPCLALEGGGAGGPVYPFDLADPAVILAGHTYYAFGTNAEAGAVQVISSPDLKHWTALGNALPNLPSWAVPGYTWAPSVIRLGNSFVLYYTALDAAADEECISVAVGTVPSGPYVDSSTQPLVCQTNLGGSIDPSPFVDTNGNVYLDWKSNGANGQPATIWSQPMNPQGTALTGSPTALLTPTQPWEGGVVEGPAMLVNSGSYDLFYAGNNWNTANYAVGVATCSGPSGPCTKPLNQPLYGNQSNLVGPGSPSVFADKSGNIWLAFHAWLPNAVGDPHSRLLFLRQLSFSNGLPVVNPPS